MSDKRQSLLKAVGFLLVGVGIGAAAHNSFISPFYAWSTWMWTGNGMGDYAETSYNYAKSPAAIKAQKEYLAYLAGVERKKAEWDEWSVPWMSEQILSYERTLTYGRIAILKVREGATAESENNWTAAEKTAAAGGWKYPDRQHIEKVIANKEAAFAKGNQPKGGANEQDRRAE